MAHLLRLTLIGGLACVLASCATQTAPSVRTAKTGRVQNVRTTAYTHNEGGSGARNAIGHRLAGGKVKSASSDWSRFPLGTHFRIVSSGDEYVIDDYGGALVGTNTIDLYKPSRLEMRRWGVRHEEIEILQWGSTDESLKILRQRRGIGRVRRMIAGLQAKQQQQPRAEVQSVHAPQG